MGVVDAELRRAAPTEVHAAGADPDLYGEVLLPHTGGLADRPLTYRIPPALRPFAAVGARTEVPLGPRRVLGVLLAVREDDGVRAARPIRDVVDIPDEPPLVTPALLALAREIAAETLSPLGNAVQCLVPPDVLRRRPPSRPRIVVRHPSRPLPARLGRRQAAMLAILDAAPEGVPVSDLVGAGGRDGLRRLLESGLAQLREAVRTPSPGAARPPVHPRDAESGGRNGGPVRPALLLGHPDARAAWITDAVASAVRDGDRALVVVPEIIDVPPMVESLRHRAAGTMTVLHSGLSRRERRAAWMRARDGAADVVVGTRSALFVPLPRLRLIILDNEPAEAHKSDAAPRYHARDVALRRARLEGARAILGASAPSVEAYAAAAAGDLSAIRLPPPRSLPVLTVVDMRAERHEGHAGYLSRALVQAVGRHLRAPGGVALLVQRTGYARVLLCRECGAAVRCPACDVAMAYDREAGTVRCRVCARTARAPDVCPRCRGVDLRGVGAGTKRIEEIVRRLFPGLRMARFDAETAGGADRVVRDFAEGRLRLLVGTARLLRAPGVRPTLVGVIDADGPMYVPDFRAAERTLQRLRAAVNWAAASGGGRPAPEVVLQTRVPDHPVMRAIRAGDDAAFYDGELAARRAFGYPPYARLARVVAEASAPAVARALAARIAAAARAQGLDVLGPAVLAAPGRARVQCVLRAADGTALRDGTRAVLARVPVPPGTRLVVDVDPQEMV